MGITITDPQAASLLRALDAGVSPDAVLAMGEAIAASLTDDEFYSRDWQFAMRVVGNASRGHAPRIPWTLAD